MIHFFPELAAMYHRSVVVSLTEERRREFFNGWTEQLWRISPDQNTFSSLPIKKNHPHI